MLNKSLELVPLFAGIPSAELSPISDRARRRTYPAKTQIVWRGDPGETLFVIQSGKVKVHSATENGSEITLAVRGPGSCFGELSLIDQSPRSADITTLEPTECLIVDGATLQDAIERSPKLAWHMMQHLAKLVREANDAVETLASRDVAGRVALLLLRLTENHGVPATGTTKGGPAKGIRIPMTLTKTDIKSFVGATREHVTNIMTEFTKAGLITTDSATGHLVVIDHDGLSKRIQ